MSMRYASTNKSDAQRHFYQDRYAILTEDVLNKVVSRIVNTPLHELKDVGRKEIRMRP